MIKQSSVMCFLFSAVRWTRMSRYSWVWSTIFSRQFHWTKLVIRTLKQQSTRNVKRVDW